MNLPAEVEIIEVGPRDGFQNQRNWIPTEIKLNIIHDLIQSGIQKMEVTSFASPEWVPQMKDGEQLLEQLFAKGIPEQICMTALALNLRGAEKAVRLGMRHLRYVVSVSESHNQANTNRSIYDTLKELEQIKKSCPELEIEVLLATCFGCSYQGTVKPLEVFSMVREILTMGIGSIGLSDTTGNADPAQVSALLSVFRETFPDIMPVLHFHDTYGMGLCNIMEALKLGFTKFDSSVGGLGGCPFSPGAAGNVATEDLNHMLLRLGIVTGIDQMKLLEALKTVIYHVSPCYSSHSAAMVRRPV